jgi:hypothetical protein
MTLEQSMALIKQCADQMDALYHNVVFDEWAVISLGERDGKVLGYLGPRKDDFQKSFLNDVGALRAELRKAKPIVGDFDFARHASGTRFDAFLVLGDGVYVICNNTTESMSALTKDSRWLSAQVPFAELTEKFRANPVVVQNHL